MPCYDSRDDLDDIEQQRALDRATRAACDLARAIQKCTPEDFWASLCITKETREWVRKHEEMDRAREREEAAERARRLARKRALAKLTPKERDLLRLR